MNFIFNEAKELVRLAGEEVGETTSTGSSVYTPFKQQMSTPDMLMNAGIVILVVFGVLFIMYVLISLAGKILATATKDSGKKPEEKPAVAAAPAAAAPAAAEEEFSSGTLKLKGCDEKTAAMIMAIVADDTGIPLSELVFKSIKLVEKK
jgi:Na+-transporting methylmalonyl-CoA/oxaloacetate decarboxylase gamma subunit